MHDIVSLGICACKGAGLNAYMKKRRRAVEVWVSGVWKREHPLSASEPLVQKAHREP